MSAFALVPFSASCPPRSAFHPEPTRPCHARTLFFTSVSRRAHPVRLVRSNLVCSQSSSESENSAFDDLVVNSPETLKKAMTMLGSIVGHHESESARPIDDDDDFQTSKNPGTAEKEFTSSDIASALLKSSIFSEAVIPNRPADAKDDDSPVADLFLSNIRSELDAGRGNSDTLIENTAASAPLHRSPPDGKSGPLKSLSDSMDEGQLFSALEPSQKSLHKLDMPALNRKLSSIHERRSRVSCFSGTDAISVVTADDVAATDDYPELRQLLEKEESEARSRWHIDSTKTASILSSQCSASETPHSALTSIAAKICFLNSEVPFRPKPFPALRKALFDSNCTKCSLCKFPVLKSDLQAGFLCSQCYSEIFVQIDSPTAPLPQHKSLEELPGDIRATVDRIWQERGTERRRASGFVAGTTRKVTTNAQFWNSASAESSSEEPKSQNVTIALPGVTSRTGSTPASPPRNPPPPKNAANGQGGGRSDKWVVNASARSLRTINPIRNLVQGIDVKPNPAKELIKLSVGDPTIYGNLRVSQKGIDKYCDVIREMQSNGYSMSMGSVEARTAVSNRYFLPEAPLSPDDIVLTAGASGAVEIAIGSLANEGDNILLPQPGFPLFRTIAEGFGVECRYYKLLPNQRWEIDLDHLATIADSRTVAIVVNNPSNPCGSVFEKSHIQELLKTAAHLHLPVIADEVYADMAFAGREFTSIGSQSRNVPVLSVGGISKQFVVPGWRLGWILIHDRGDVFQRGQVRKGIRQLTTRMLVPNTPAQAVLPTLLNDGVNDSTFREIMKELEVNAEFTVKALASAPGIRCIEPQGSMYTMVEIDANLLGFEDDMQFTKALLQEESVFVLPGQCFQAPNFVRIVFCAPQVVLSEAFHRIRSFCSRHAGVL